MFPENKVMIWDDSKGKVALEISTLSAVRGVQLSKTRVVVVLVHSVRVYAFEKQPKPLAIYETASNPQGLCCLSDKYLVFPGRTPGQVQLVHLATDSVSIIPAHNSSLRALTLSPDGEMLATASEKVGVSPLSLRLSNNLTFRRERSYAYSPPALAGRLRNDGVAVRMLPFSRSDSAPWEGNWRVRLTRAAFIYLMCPTVDGILLRPRLALECPATEVILLPRPRINGVSCPIFLSDPFRTYTHLPKLVSKLTMSGFRLATC